MAITIIGAGYVGLVTGACMADLGNKVYCLDIDKNKIKQLKRGKCPFYEPELEDLIKVNIRSRNLVFSTELKEAIANSKAIFLAVNTPSLENGDADISYVTNAVHSIIKIYKDFLKTHPSAYRVIVTKSTVPVGVTRQIEKMLCAEGVPKKNFGVVSNPEFLREGTAVRDFFRPDRVVIGGNSQQAMDLVSDIYRPLYRIDVPFVKTDIETSELIKYAANAFLATKVSFINEIANLCEKVNADVHVVAKAMGQDGRIGRYFLHPGPGYGGACFPKDTRALSAIAKNNNVPLRIVDATIAANEHQRSVVFQKLVAVLGQNLKDKTICILGLSFKPNTDDMRESPVIPLVESLLESGADINAYDPVAMENAKKLWGDRVQLVDYIDDAFKEADAIVVMTEWNNFREIDFDEIATRVRQKVVIDARNIYDPEKLKAKGFQYFGIGRL